MVAIEKKIVDFITDYPLYLFIDTLQSPKQSTKIN